MLAALDAREVSSVELVDLHLERIDQLDGALNAITVRTADRARESAAAADAARASGGQGALLGLPMTLKESTQTAGLPQSAGIEPLAEYRPATDGPIAARVFAEGACLLGKTNIPVGLGDWQADSPVYGRTNNPWDLSRTPGGSTGGGGAALAVGMTPLEIGSDIGGSIRVPAAYCGVYGHRPSETAIPRAGAFPFADLPNPAFVMGVQGPLARSALDLELLFDVVAGPEEGEGVAWQLSLPASRHERLADFRVAIMPPVSLVQPSSEVQAKVDELASFLGRAGAHVAEAMPELDETSYFRDYLTLLTVLSPSDRAPTIARRGSTAWLAATSSWPPRQVAGLQLDASDYLELHRAPGGGETGVADVLRRVGRARLPDGTRCRLPAPDRSAGRSSPDRRRSGGPLHAQPRLPDVGHLSWPTGDGVPRRYELGRLADRVAGDRSEPRGPHDAGLRPAARARVERLRRSA